VNAARLTRFCRSWERHPSGLLLPSGHFSSATGSGSVTYLEAKGKAQFIRAEFERSGVRWNPKSDLARIVSATELLSDRWLTGQELEITTQDIFDAVRVDQIASAIERTPPGPQRDAVLRRLLDGSLSMYAAERTKAKDALWELEVVGVLNQRGQVAQLHEPPDVRVVLGDESIGISCKNIYSEAHIQNVLSKAVRQLARAGCSGLAAINIDHLLPRWAVRAASSRETALRSLPQCGSPGGRRVRNEPGPENPISIFRMHVVLARDSMRLDGPGRDRTSCWFTLVFLSCIAQCCPTKSKAAQGGTRMTTAST